jgi:hypothetical protein
MSGQQALMPMVVMDNVERYAQHFYFPAGGPRRRNDVGQYGKRVRCRCRGGGGNIPLDSGSRQSV